MADLLHPYACHGLSHSLPSWPGLDADSRRVLDSLPDAPLDCMFLYTDGSFVEHTHTAAWAVVVLGAQQGCFCLIGVLGNTCSEGRVDRRAYEGEIEAILHARAVALAAAPTPCHIVSDCTSAIAAAGGCTRVLPEDDVTKGAVGLAFASFAFGQPIIAHHTYSHVGCPFNDTADWIAKGCARGMMLPSANAGAADLVQAARLGLLQNLWLTAPDGFAQAQLPFLNQQGVWAAAAAFQEPCTRPTLPEALQPWQGAATKQQTLTLRLLQYNCLSQKGWGASGLMAKSLATNRVSVAGLQETRLKMEGISKVDGYWVISAPCTARGVGGCQLWIQSGEHGGYMGPLSFVGRTRRAAVPGGSGRGLGATICILCGTCTAGPLTGQPAAGFLVAVSGPGTQGSSGMHPLLLCRC